LIQRRGGGKFAPPLSCHKGAHHLVSVDAKLLRLASQSEQRLRQNQFQPQLRSGPTAGKTSGDPRSLRSAAVASTGVMMSEAWGAPSKMRTSKSWQGERGHLLSWGAEWNTVHSSEMLGVKFLRKLFQAIFRKRFNRFCN